LGKCTSKSTWMSVTWLPWTLFVLWPEQLTLKRVGSDRLTVMASTSIEVQPAMAISSSSTGGELASPFPAKRQRAAAGVRGLEMVLTESGEIDRGHGPNSPRPEANRLPRNGRKFGVRSRSRSGCDSKKRSCSRLRRCPSTGICGGLWRLRLAYQISQPMPGGAQIRPPAHGILQIHPQSRTDRVGTYHLESNRL
jgi:hypothetical protein